MIKKSKPFLKWAGNKYQCLHAILSEFPNAKRLIEPFTGSGSIFMNTHYSHYLLAEENLDIISLFQHVQQEGLCFIEYCKTFFSPCNNESSRYYQLRETFNHCTEPRQRAALFLYLNRHGYNGLCRYNQKGIYNVPFGRYIKPYFPEKEMGLFHEKSKYAHFIKSDFRETFTHQQLGDLIYCDPPYAPRSQSSNFSTYTDRKFGEAEQIALALLAKEAAAQGATVIISNHDTPFTRELYAGASTIKSFAVKRLISCHAKNRHPVHELLAVFD